MNRAQKEYPDRAFSVEATKLMKLRTTIHDKLGEGNTRDRFSVHMKGDRKDELSSLEEVLNLDNSRKHRIKRLIIHSLKVDERSDAPSREIEVDFGAPIRTQDGASKIGVTIDIAGESSAWISDALSDVEQQVERTWTSRTTPLLVFLAILVTFLFSIALSIEGSAGRTARALSSTMWLERSEIDAYASQLAAGNSLSEADTRDILSKQLSNLSDSLKRQEESRQLAIGPLLPILIPGVLLISLSLLILVLCYPSAVFLWGDEKDRQQWRDNAKRYLWPLLIATTFVPIVSQLVVSGFLSGIVR